MKVLVIPTLRSERLRLRLSLGDVAARAGLSSSTVSRVESGETRSPQAVTVRALLAALAVNEGDLPPVRWVWPRASPLTVADARAIVAASEPAGGTA